MSVKFSYISTMRVYNLKITLICKQKNTCSLLRLQFPAKQNCLVDVLHYHKETACSLTKHLSKTPAFPVVSQSKIAMLKAPMLCGWYPETNTLFCQWGDWFWFKAQESWEPNAYAAWMMIRDGCKSGLYFTFRTRWYRDITLTTFNKFQCISKIHLFR